MSPVSDRGAIEAVEGRVSSVFESHDAIFDGSFRNVKGDNFWKSAAGIKWGWLFFFFDHEKKISKKNPMST